MLSKKGYVVTFAFFVGNVPLEVLNDVATATKTKLIGAEVVVVLEDRTAARAQFIRMAKNAARSYLVLVQRARAFRKLSSSDNIRTARALQKDRELSPGDNI